MDVSIEQLPALRVAAVRHVGSFSEISSAFTQLGDIAGRAGLFGPSATMLAIYHDDPMKTPAAQLRSDAGVTVPEGAPIPAGLEEQRIPAGPFARVTHIGPYDQLPAVWHSLMGEWLPKSGKRVGAGGTIEIYRNTPMDTPTDRLHTDLYVSVEG